MFTAASPSKDENALVIRAPEIRHHRCCDLSKISLHQKDSESLLPPVTIGRPGIWIAGITKIELAGYDIIEALPLKKLHRFEPGTVELAAIRFHSVGKIISSRIARTVFSFPACCWSQAIA
jgi:hypothetical protein